MTKTNKPKLPTVDSLEYQIQKAFTFLLFDVINLPSMDSPEVSEALSKNKIKIAYRSESSEFAVVLDPVDDENEIEPIMVINANAILQLMKANHPLKEVADLFDGREHGNIITLDEAIELNKNGRVIVVPCSDDRIHIYGYGEAPTMVGQTEELGIGGFTEDKEVVCFYVPSHKGKFISTDEFNDTVNVLNNLQGGKLEYYPVVAYQDPSLGFIVDVEGADTLSFTIYEDGNIYGQGLVMEI